MTNESRARRVLGEALSAARLAEDQLFYLKMQADPRERAWWTIVHMEAAIGPISDDFLIEARRFYEVPEFRAVEPKLAHPSVKAEGIFVFGDDKLVAVLSPKGDLVVHERTSKQLESVDIPTEPRFNQLPIDNVRKALALLPGHRRSAEESVAVDGGRVPVAFYAKALRHFEMPAQGLKACKAQEFGSYKGEILFGSEFVAQCTDVSKLVFHETKDLLFVDSEHALQARDWARADGRHALDGQKVQIHYDANQGKVYPWDKVREQLSQLIGSMKATAQLVDVNPDFDRDLERVKEALLRQADRQTEGHQYDGKRNAPRSFLRK